jgi:hypothetical protein
MDKFVFVNIVLLLVDYLWERSFAAFLSPWMHGVWYRWGAKVHGALKKLRHWIRVMFPLPYNCSAGETWATTLHDCTTPLINGSARGPEWRLHGLITKRQCQGEKSSEIALMTMWAYILGTENFEWPEAQKSPLSALFLEVHRGSLVPFYL